MCKPKYPVAIFTVLCVLTTSMSPPAAAAEAGWMVNGTKLTGTAALSTTAAVHEKFALTFAGEEIDCNGEDLTLVKPTINGASRMNDTESLEFNKCATGSPCVLATSTIRTLPVLVDLTLDGALAVRGHFLPTNTSKTLATIEFEGTECTFAGAEPIKGTLAFLAPTEQSENTLQLIRTKTETNGELNLGLFAVTVSGSFLLRLANGGSFSFL